MALLSKEPSARPRWLNLAIAWVWAGLFISWTGALLSPVPPEAVKALGGSGNAFTFGKTLHVSVYMILAWMAAFLPLSRRHRWVALTALIVHTGVVEILQGFTGRTPALRDVGLDLTGIAIGFLLTRRRWLSRSILPSSLTASSTTCPARWPTSTPPG